MHELSERVSRAASKASKVVPNGTKTSKTWNVYVNNKHSKKSFVLGLLVGAIGGAYIVFKKSEAARKDLAERVEALKISALEKTSDTVERVKPVVQDALDKSAERVNEAAEAVQEKTDQASAKVDKASNKVTDEARSQTT